MRNQFTQAIGELRGKLIDTSRRNKLINYRRPSKSTNLKIIDESAEFIFNYLVNEENKFKFKFIPEPKLDVTQKIDKDKIETLQKIVEESIHQGEKQSAQFQLEKLLNQQSKGNILLSPEERAKQLGYDVSLELLDINLESDDLKDKHTHDSLQTLHYPNEMEKILTNIERKSKNIIQETGSNMLYLIICVLEWSDGKNINQSPLISIPVVLTKVKRDGKLNFFLEYTSENIDTNFSLAERLLNDFNIILPEINDETTFRSYINEVINTIKNQSSWRIKQEICLDFLHFGKFLMFQDLKEENWNDKNKLINNAILKDMLVGKDVSSESINPQIQNDFTNELPIVMDADSSQYSAIQDVINGKNVIIEGPPGTGKSQTISNIIATLLHQNKSVLFVSEKLAALEVVYKRLDNVGLSDFCLELHSNKTQKIKVLESLGKRIDGYYDYNNQIDDDLIEFSIHSDDLKSYSELLHNSYGNINKSIFDIFWETDKYLEASNYLKFDVINVENYTQLEVNKIIEELEKYISFHNNYDFNTFYWNKLELSNLSFVDIDDFIDIFINKREFLIKLNEELNSLNVGVEDEYSEIEKIHNFVKSNDKNLDNVNNKILKELANHFELFKKYKDSSFSLKDFSINVFQNFTKELFVCKQINQKLIDLILLLKNDYEYITTNLKINGSLTVKNINNCLKTFELFGKVEKDLFLNLNKEFNNNNILELIKELESEHKNYKHIKDEITVYTKLEELDIIENHKLDTLSEEITKFSEYMVSIIDGKEKSLLVESENILSNLINLNENICEILELEKRYDLNFINDIKNLFNILIAIDKYEYLNLTNDNQDVLSIDDLKNFYSSIKEFEISFNNYFDLKNSLIQIVDLEKLNSVLLEEIIINEKTILANKDSLFRFFNNSYKQAKKEFEYLLKDKLPSDKKKWEEILYQIKHYLKAKDEFNNNENFKRVFKNLFKGENTDLEKIKELNEWYLLFNKIENNSIRQVVNSINERKYDYLVRLKNQYLEILNKFNINLVNINSSFDKNFLRNIYASTQNIVIDEFFEKIKIINENFREINNKKIELETLLKDKLPSDKKKWEEILFQIKHYLKAKDEFNNNDNFKRVFKNLFKGEDTNLEKIKELSCWFEEIKTIAINQNEFIDLILESESETYDLIIDFKSKLSVQNIKLTNEILELEKINNLAYLNSLYKDKTDIDYLEVLNKIELVNIKINSLKTYCKEALSLNIVNLEDDFFEKINIDNLKQASFEVENFEVESLNILKTFKILFDKINAVGEISSKIEIETSLVMSLNNLNKNIIEIATTSKLYELIISSNLNDEIKSWIINNFEKYNQIVSIRSYYEKYLIANKELEKFTNFDKSFYSENEKLSIQNCLDKLCNIEENKNSLSIWCDLNRISKKLRELGLEKILDKVENDNLKKDLVIPIFNFNFYNTLVKKIFRENELLQQFSRLNHEQIIEKFKELDKNLIFGNRYIVAETVSKKNIPYGYMGSRKSDLTELSLIENELSKKKRHIPIRQLVRRSPNALKALKPCFMMSPLSVSQYLPNNEIKFDVLVIDEASQLKPEEALGSIARASQIVIVGDPKQLPPTSFFQAVDKNEDEDETKLIDLKDYIIDLINIYKPIKQLRWHYRSQHESLIDFSNQQFYDNNLIVFPSPTGIYNEKMGVKYHYIENAYFHLRKNKVEAKILVEHLLIQMKENPNISIGVGTFNGEQRDLIQELIDEKEKNNSFVANYIAKWNETSEPFFVKNLENLQGDERDVIMISTTYGMNVETNKIHQRFGPINSDVGWRRLNVMFTRSKQKMEIFTSLKSNDIRITENSSRGVKSLKAFLNYIETGLLKKSYEENLEQVNKNGFEISIINILNKYGYEAVSNLGVSGVFIDLAVKSTKNPNDFVLAIECDGSNYNNSKSLRDRERLKNDVLKNLGWNLYRIWSADWYKNREFEISKLLEVIKKAQLDYKGPSLEEIENKKVLNQQIKVEKVISIDKDIDKEIKIEKEYHHHSEVEIKQSEYKQMFLDDTMLKEMLVELRDTKIAKEFKIDRRSILSDMMIELFVKHKPLNIDDFRNKIPQRYRNENVIDVEQMKYINDIFDILEMGDE